MNAVYIIINNRKYNVIVSDTFVFSDGTIRLYVESKNGERKRALFNKAGDFDCWDTPPKARSKFSRVNMRG